MGHEEYEIERLKQDVEYYKSRYELVCKINDQHIETISTYAKIVKLQAAELNKLRGETK